MALEPSIFEKTYKNYLAEVSRLDLKSSQEMLGIQVEGDTAIVPLFGKPYRVSKSDIIAPSGKRPSFDSCVILCKYLLLCPHMHPKEKEWVAFRDLKDSGPLISYFANDVEQAMATRFSERLRELAEASNALGGRPPDMDLSYELSVQFDPLPRVPLLMLFSDKD
ncbi:MAG: DUF3786 domain-containing protein, partial [Deltaproteobacteria bacterium]|nr:DUF3786 domain-containing protein [Deltaproteobacteria bacterium]